jgi:glycosyltransferase involved in cell wall biosynthesis
MRILMLTPHANVRGPLPKHTPVLVAALRNAGCEVITVPWGRHSDDDSLVARTASRMRDVFRVRHRVRREDFDVMVVKTAHEWPALLRDIPLLLATRRSSPRTVLQFHGGQSQKLVEPGGWLFKALSWVLFRLSDGALMLSTQEVIASAEFYPRGKFRTVINPYVAPLATAVVGKRQRLVKGSSAPTLLFSSRLMAEKGVLDAVEAFAVVRRQRACRLLVAGDGPARGELLARAAALGIAEDVTVAGHMTGEELLAIYRDAYLFLLPTYWPEGFPTAITEAMSAGLPVVTTRLRGMADHLTEGVNALFVPPKAPVELARAIRRLLDDGALRQRMGRANRAKVGEFAPAVAARRYIEALDAIAGRCGSA